MLSGHCAASRMNCIPLGSLTLLISNLVWNKEFIILQTSIIFNTANAILHFGKVGILLDEKPPHSLFNDVNKRITIAVFL
jgi:hypothetical protein